MIPNRIIAETPRLKIQTWELTDVSALCALTRMPGLSEFSIGGYADFSADRASAWIKQEMGRYARFRLGKFGVVEKRSGELIGICGLFHLPQSETDIEMNYRLVQAVRRQGFAFEAAAAVLGYGFDVLNLPQIFANVANENAASLSLLKKLRMQLLGEITYAGIPASRWRMTREEFDAIFRR